MQPTFYKAESGSGLALEALDRAALVSLKQGHVTLEQEITQLFVTWRDPIYRYLLEVFGHPAVAEEITQEAFLRLYRSLKSGRAVKNPRAWLFRVAHNLALDQQKSGKRMQLLDAELWAELCESQPDRRPDPEQSALERERFARLRVALQRLSTQERQCLYLRAEGFRYREVGEILGISQWTVVEYLRRAIGKLMTEMP
jgi:RNA polymerase sigma-70 factor, ECF subfamily